MSGPLILPWKGVSPRIAADAFIAPNAVLIGDIEIGSQSSIWFGCTIRADVHFVRIGSRTNIQDGTIIHINTGTHHCIIGQRVTVGHGAIIHACTVEDDCMIGIAAVVLDGAVVERNAIVAAGAVVQLTQHASDPVGLYVNDKLVAYGEVVVVEDKLAVQLTEIVKRSRMDPGNNR